MNRYFFKAKTIASILTAVTAVLISGFSVQATAQESEAIYLDKLEGEINLDGIPDEKVWEEVTSYPLVMYEPVFKGEMNERTRIKVAYDENYIYVAGWLYHQDTGDIRLNSLYRDRYSEDDTFAIIIDPFNDNENGLWFFINPGGVRFDLAISNDMDLSSGGFGSTINPSWNTYWKAETQITDEGWTAEIRIPFSSIGLQVEDGNAEIGMILYRYISKGYERHIYPAIPPNWNLGNAKPSQAQDVVLQNVDASKPVYFTPYLLGGFSTQPELNDASTDYESKTDFTREAGFDVKYNVSSNTTIDATFNTDFAQVEADDQQINLTRFPLFFPEKRQFFQERASVFSFGLGGVNQLFFSRRIGLDPTGEPIRIWGGARVTSRVEDWDIGFLNMQTDNSSLLPSENFGVLRVKKTAFNRNSYLGGMLTSRVSEGNYNYALGLDGVVKVVGDEYLTVRYAQSVYDGLAASERYYPGNTGFLRVEWNRRSNTGFYYIGAFTKAGRDFNPGIGFITRTDFYSALGGVAYGKLYDHPTIRRWDISTTGSYFFRNSDHTIESSNISLQSNLNFNSGGGFSGQLNLNYEDLLRTTSFLPATSVPAGSYNFVDAGLSYTMAPFNKLRTSLQGGAGQFYDGYTYQFSASPVWNVSKHLELGGTYILNSIEFPDRDEQFTAHVVRFRIQSALNRQFSASTFAQYSNVADLVGLNVRFRYNFGEGRDLWLVYNEQLNSDRYPASAVVTPIPASQARVVLLKFSYSLNLNQ